METGGPRSVEIDYLTRTRTGYAETDQSPSACYFGRVQATCYNPHCDVKLYAGNI